MNTNYDSVLLVGTLNALARMTGNGIIDFETYADNPSKYEGWLVYDKSNARAVCDMCVDDLHQSIVGYYDDVFPDVEIKVVIECYTDAGTKVLFVDVTLPNGGIVVENGTWYVYDYY